MSWYRNSCSLFDGRGARYIVHVRLDMDRFRHGTDSARMPLLLERVIQSTFAARHSLRCDHGRNFFQGNLLSGRPWLLEQNRYSGQSVSPLVSPRRSQLEWLGQQQCTGQAKPEGAPCRTRVRDSLMTVGGRAPPRWAPTMRLRPRKRIERDKVEL